MELGGDASTEYLANVLFPIIGNRWNNVVDNPVSFWVWIFIYGDTVDCKIDTVSTIMYGKANVDCLVTFFLNGDTCP